jgi:alkyl hydroperoxide reductase subunit AhpC
MLIIDKKEDAMTLRNLGATEHQIANIFMIEGRLISLVGAIIGIVLGLSLCLIQQHFGIIKFGHSAGSYIIDSYPVSVHVTDIIIVFITVLVVGLISVWYPVRQLSKKYTSVLAVLLVAGMMTSCGTNDRQFKIEGRFKDMPAGELYIYNQDYIDSKIDTIYINNGEFAYAGNAEELTPYTLVFPNALEQVIFVQNGSVIHYNASANDLKNYTVDGNEENELMNEFRKQTNGMNAAQQREVAETFINDHSESAVAIYLFDRYLVQDQSTSIKTLKKVIKTLKKAQPQNRLVMKVENTLKQIENGQVGKTIPSIELTAKSKRTINIGKTNEDYTVLVFWSTWMPGRYDFIDEFVVLTEDYAEYKNVKIVAISLDSEIFKWENAIREDTTYCEHVCDGKVWDSAPVKKLGITSVPTFIIADKNHKIVARGSSVGEMDKELQKLVD